MFWFSSNKYSQKQHYITEREIRKLTTWVGLDSLKESESELVRKEIVKKRGSDGRMSLYQIYGVLTKLKNERKISKFDRQGLMKRFEGFFGE